MNARFTVAANLEPKDDWFDECGFAAPGAIPEKRAAFDLLSADIVVVTGDPWIGKTYVSKELTAEAERRAQERTSPPGGAVFVDRLSLEDGTQAPTPLWWSAWLASREDAWWIIDALDEAIHLGNVGIEAILRPYIALTHDQRRRLHLVIFTRDDDSLAEIRSSLASKGIRVEVRRLLPFDKQEAQRIVVGSGRSFDQVLRHLQVPSLRPLARYEPVLRVLAGSADERPRVEVLKEVLETLCGEHSAHRRMERAELWNKHDMFRAASRIAAVMMLCDISTVQLELGFGQLRLAEVFSSCPELKNAAELLRHTTIFRKEPTGFRFRQQYVKELLAAFGLRGLAPEALRLLTRGNAPHIPPRLVALEMLLRDLHPRAFDDPLPHLTQLAQVKSARWAADRIDRLLAATGDAPLRTPRREEALRTFKVRGVEHVLEKRLADQEIPEGGRELLFRIAFACELSQLSPCAVRIAMDGTEPPELRVLAAYFATRFGGRAALVSLRQLLEPSEVVQPPRLRSRIVEVLVNEGMLDPLDAAAITPAPEEHLYDAREAAVAAIERQLTLDHARQVVDDWTGEPSLPPGVPIEVRERLRSRSVDVLLAHASSGPDDVGRIVRLLEIDDSDHLEALYRRLDARVAADPAFREAVYTRLLDSRIAPRVSFALHPSDVSWLLRLARANPAPAVLDDLYRLMRSLQSGDQLHQGARVFFESEYPGELAARDARWSRADAEMRELEARRQRHRSPAAPLLDIVEKILRDDSELALRFGDWGPTRVLHLLGWICFVEPAFRPHDVSGSFPDLPAEVQSRVIAKVREVLGTAQPEPLPPATEGAYSGNLLYEAASFRAAVTFDSQRAWLTPPVIARWLPALLFAGHDDIPAVVAELLRKSPEQTRACVLEAVERELTREHAMVARQLPKETWTEDFSERVGALIASGEDVSAGRASLLRLLAVRSPWVALRLARQLFVGPGSHRTTRLTAADVILAVEPEALTWPELGPLLERTEDVETLAGLLHSPGGDPRVDASRLQPSILAELAQRLVDLYPRLPDSERFGPRWVGKGDEARDARDRLLAALITRAASSPEAARGVERLSAADSRFAMWASAARATSAIDAALEEIEPEPPLPALEDVVRALDEASYRPIRTELDLWRLIAEILQDAVGPSVGHDIDLLYNVPSRSGPGSKKPRRDETKLQAYVRRRLEDLFPRYWRTVGIELLREPQTKFRRRFDILVVATLPGSKTGAIPIELKWSDDSRCERALSEQLVDKYLLSAGRRHGIYLVGWCGSPKGATWKGRKRSHMKQIARASSSRHALRVASAYLECPWQDPGTERAGSRKKRRRRP